MKKNTKKPWVIELACPYCKNTIITAYDFSMLPHNMSHEDREKITCSEDGWDETEGSCPHLAFQSDWAYSGHCVLGWENEMYQLACELSEEIPEENDIAEIIGHAIGKMTEEEFENALNKVLSYIDHKTIEQYVEKYDGISHGGPTYRLIFLKNKA